MDLSRLWILTTHSVKWYRNLLVINFTRNIWMLPCTSGAFGGVSVRTLSVEGRWHFVDMCLLRCAEGRSRRAHPRFREDCACDPLAASAPLERKRRTERQRATAHRPRRSGYPTPIDVSACNFRPRANWEKLYS